MPARLQTLKALRFHDLMPFRVADVLLVSSPYDAFILQQDGQLTERLLREYGELSLPASPRFTHVPTAAAALELLGRRNFDLVITMTSLTDGGLNDFGRRVKAIPPGRPVVLLALDRKELHEIEDEIDPEVIDGTFLWNGDSKILLAAIKYVEDRRNVDHDVEHGDVKVIVVIEDSPAYYSSFLGILYKELKRQARSLYSEGVNETLRQMYAKSRPKILHAASYEKALELLERYSSNLLAVISDAAIPRGGELADDGGLDFVQRAREIDPALPVLLHSSDALKVKEAEKIDASFVWKSSPHLEEEIRDFFLHSLGFGDFIFRDAEGREVDRARDLREFEEKLTAVPEESIVYHAARNHFSLWLAARSEFELAERLRPQQVTDFGDAEATRRYLIDVLRETGRSIHRGVVSDFDRACFADELFSRLGQGSLGGKARGIAFMNMQLAELGVGGLGGLDVKMPKTVVVASECFDVFLAENGLTDFAYSSEDDDEIARRFLAAEICERFLDDLAFVIDHIDGPLAMRSSSLLEDSMHQPMAGIYSTLMLPNRAGELADRLRDAAVALKLIYASTFFANAKSYLKNTGNRVEDEKMAVIVQQLVGRRHGNRFYPTISGVAQSYNYYPIAPQQAEDGIVHLALGLGRLVVDDGRAVRFSPRHPDVLPRFSNPEAVLANSQRSFYALDLSYRWSAADTGLYSSVRQLDLADAEEDGTLALVGSVFSPDDQRIRDDLSKAGPRVVTFNNILKHRAFPLPQAVARLLAIGEAGLACPVEIELACDLAGWDEAPSLYVLQIRPFARRGMVRGPRMRFGREETLAASRRSLGNGIDRTIRDVVYVCRERWRAEHNAAIAAEVGELNRELESEQRPYLVAGPGRWGTADEWLGIPVEWSQISGVRVIVEASPAGYDIELSQGTHFFQNITSLEIGYLSLPPGADKADPASEEYVDWRWLDGRPAHRETDHLRWLRFDEPLTVVLDGHQGRGVVGKPAA